MLSYWRGPWRACASACVCVLLPRYATPRRTVVTQSETSVPECVLSYRQGRHHFQLRRRRYPSLAAAPAFCRPRPCSPRGVSPALWTSFRTLRRGTSLGLPCASAPQSGTPRGEYRQPSVQAAVRANPQGEDGDALGTKERSGTCLAPRHRRTAPCRLVPKTWALRAKSKHYEPGITVHRSRGGCRGCGDEPNCDAPEP